MSYSAIRCITESPAGRALDHIIVVCTDLSVIQDAERSDLLSQLPTVIASNRTKGGKSMKTDGLAERMGFEPTVRSPARTLSKGVP